MRRELPACAIHAATIAAIVLMGAACQAPAYAPLLIDLDAPLPEDAFARCRTLLGRRFGALAVVDEAAFRLQSEWAPAAEFAGERRASLFLDRGEIAVVVEARWIQDSAFGSPAWSAARGDPAAERELAEALRQVLLANAPP